MSYANPIKAVNQEIINLDFDDSSNGNDTNTIQEHTDSINYTINVDDSSNGNDTNTIQEHTDSINYTINVDDSSNDNYTNTIQEHTDSINVTPSQNVLSYSPLIDLSEKKWSEEPTLLSCDMSDLPLIDLLGEEGDKERGDEEENQDPWEDECDNFDNLFDDESLVLMEDVNDGEDDVVTIDDELSPSEGFVKTLQEIAEEEEKDVYDPEILGKIIIMVTQN